MSKKKYIGISLEEDVLKIAQVHLSKGKISLDSLDRISLVNKIDQKNVNLEIGESDKSNYESMEVESVFGIDDEEQPSNGSLSQTTTEPSVKKENTDILSIAEGESSDTVESNEVLIHNLLASINTRKVNLALNIPAGSTIFQIVRDQNHKELKKKDLNTVIDDKLESIYGSTKSSDHYGYEIREDGALVLASNDNEIDLLNLIDQSKDLYSGKVFINDILSDEAILVGLVRNHYNLEENEITGIVHLGPKNTRLVFLKGNEILSVTPLINEGTGSSHVLSTIFSKILFQLDTGELPSLEKIIISNNVIGDKAISFFKKNFPDIDVEDLQFDNTKVEVDPELEKTAHQYTTAIGLACAAAGYKNDAYKAYSFLPTYVADRQKVFKLQWHGILLLALIAIVPALINFAYQRNLKKINSLQNEILRTNTQLENVRPLVIGVNDLSMKYNQIDKQMAKLQELNKGTNKWANTLFLFNNGVRKVNSCWITEMRNVKDGIVIHGYSLYRNRIPRFTDLFSKSVLQNVNISKVKGKKIYKFTVLIQKVFKNQGINKTTK